MKFSLILMLLFTQTAWSKVCILTGQTTQTEVSELNRKNLLKTIHLAKGQLRGGELYFSHTGEDHLELYIVRSIPGLKKYAYVAHTYRLISKAGTVYSGAINLENEGFKQLHVSRDCRAYMRLLSIKNLNEITRVTFDKQTHTLSIQSGRGSKLRQDDMQDPEWIERTLNLLKQLKVEGKVKTVLPEYQAPKRDCTCKVSFDQECGQGIDDSAVEMSWNFRESIAKAEKACRDLQLEFRQLYSERVFCQSRDAYFEPEVKCK